MAAKNDKKGLTCNLKIRYTYTDSNPAHNDEIIKTEFSGLLPKSNKKGVIKIENICGLHGLDEYNSTTPARKPFSKNTLYLIYASFK